MLAETGKENLKKIKFFVSVAYKLPIFQTYQFL